MPDLVDNLRSAIRPVLFIHNGFGDRIMALPTIRAIAEYYKGRLEIIADERDAHIFFQDVSAKKITGIRIFYKNDRVYLNVETLSKILHFSDAFLCLSPWHTPELDEVLKSIPHQTILGHTPGFKNYIDINPKDHIIDTDFQFARLLNPKISLVRYSQMILPNKMEKEIVDNFTKQSKKIILVAHFSTQKHKKVPDTILVDTIDKLLGVFFEITIICVDPYNERPLERCNKSIEIKYFSSDSIRASFYLVSKADIFWGVDSCMLHAADLSRVPSIAMFPATDSVQWGCRFTPMHKHLNFQQSYCSEFMFRSLLGYVNALEENKKNENNNRSRDKYR